MALLDILCKKTENLNSLDINYLSFSFQVLLNFKPIQTCKGFYGQTHNNIKYWKVKWNSGSLIKINLEVEIIDMANIRIDDVDDEDSRKCVSDSTNQIMMYIAKK